MLMPVKFQEPTVEQYFRTFRIGTFAVDEAETRLLFSANMDGKVNVWALVLDRGYPYPLTTLGENCGVLLPDAQGRYVVAAFYKDGDENWQAYAMSPAGGQLEPLLVAESEKYYPVDLSKDGGYLHCISTLGNASYL